MKLSECLEAYFKTHEVDVEVRCCMYGLLVATYGEEGQASRFVDKYIREEIKEEVLTRIAEATRIATA